METIYFTIQSINITQAYYTDIQLLKKEFLILKNDKKLTEEFGLPFLLIKKEQKIIGYVSLIITDNDNINFRVNYFSDLHENTKKTIYDQVEKYFRSQKTANFSNVSQLKFNINNLIYWLNS